MDFEAAVRFLDKTTGESISARFPGRLDRMRSLLRHVEEPHRRFSSVHVGGTAGKGSTATMSASILSAAGFKVGLHTKPHLHAVTERARIDGAPIAPQRFAAIFERLAAVYSIMRHEQWGPPSYFELLVALSFLYFAEEKVDVAVVEVGVGGSLDGTNLIVPKVSVITNVGTDHHEILGDTVEQIARDKSGIIKDGVPIVSAAEQPTVRAIIAEAAATHNAPLTFLNDAAKIQSTVDQLAYSQSVSIQTSLDSYSFVLPLIGEFQAVNAATAIVALETIHDEFKTSAADVARALSQLSLPGRTEYYPSRPSLLFDVAHNAEKAAALRAAIERHFPNRRLVFVVAIAQEKDADAVIEAWRGLPAQFVFTTFEVSHRRSRHSRNLVNVAEANGLVARAVDDPVEALGVARRIAAADDLIVVTGSTFLVGTLRRWLLENTPQERPVNA